MPITSTPFDDLADSLLESADVNGRCNRRRAKALLEAVVDVVLNYQDLVDALDKRPTPAAHLHVVHKIREHAVALRMLLDRRTLASETAQLLERGLEPHSCSLDATKRHLLALRYASASIETRYSECDGGRGRPARQALRETARALNAILLQYNPEADNNERVEFLRAAFTIREIPHPNSPQKLLALLNKTDNN